MQSYVTCRVLNRHGNQCTGEAVDPHAELKICTRHLAEAQRIIHDAYSRAAAKAPTRGGR
ncbi:hypothetical protein ACWDWT_30815 [Streptomyces sp. NPDC003343]